MFTTCLHTPPQGMYSTVVLCRECCVHIQGGLIACCIKFACEIFSFMDLCCHKAGRRCFCTKQEGFCKGSLVGKVLEITVTQLWLKQYNRLCSTNLFFWFGTFNALISCVLWWDWMVFYWGYYPHKASHTQLKWFFKANVAASHMLEARFSVKPLSFLSTTLHYHHLVVYSSRFTLRCYS